MAQKIKGYVSRSDARVMNSRESLEEYVPLFAPYFKAIGNNISNVESGIVEDACYIYSKVRKIESCDGECNTCNKVFELSKNEAFEFDNADAIWEWMYLGSMEAIFMRSVPATHTKRLCSKSLLIIYNGYVIAEYCKNKNILLATDWTNDNSKLSFVRHSLDELETAKVLTKLKKSNKPQKPIITLGTDPEMETIVSGCVVDAHNLPSLLEDKIGRDGAGYQRELRPSPGKTPQELLDNIEYLIKYTDEQWSLAGEKYSLGGHIHIGGVKESKAFVTALDYFLEPLMKLNSGIRKNSDYGKKGDCRIQKYPGGVEGLEYRTPPSAWLSTRTLALTTLTIVNRVAEKHYSGEDIDITNDLVADLIALGLSENMAKDFPVEIDKLINNVPKDWKKSWGIKSICKPDISFRDTWEPNVKRMLSEEINSFLVTLEYSEPVVFYGLKSSRGVDSLAIDTSSVRVTGINGVEIIEAIRDGIGVGHTFRTRTTDIARIMPILKEYFTKLAGK